MEIRVTRRSVIIAAVVAAAVGGWFLVDWLIVTDRERAEQAVRDVARAVETNEAGALTPLLDPSFRLGRMDLAEFRTWYAGILRVPRVKRVSVREVKAEIDAHDPDLAVAKAGTVIVLERPAGESHLDWQLEFRRRGAREWKLAGVRAWWAVNGVEVQLDAAAEWLRRIGGTR